jgi:transposase
VNRARSRAKVLLWDGTGLCITIKRLESGCFACFWNRKEGGRSVELTMSELALSLEGSELVGRISPPRIEPSPLPQLAFE